MKWSCPYGKPVPTRGGKLEGRRGVATEIHLGRPITLTQPGSVGDHVFLSILEAAKPHVPVGCNGKDLQLRVTGHISPCLSSASLHASTAEGKISDSCYSCPGEAGWPDSPLSWFCSCDFRGWPRCATRN